MDYNFHKFADKDTLNLETLRSLGADVRRGSLGTVERRKSNFPVFHTGDFLENPSRLDLPEVPLSQIPAKTIIARPGDILMARVDRFLHDKLAFFVAGHVPVTDCIFRIRLPEQHVDKVFEALASGEARRRIQATAKGVGARVLGKADLLDLPLIPSCLLAVA